MSHISAKDFLLSEKIKEGNASKFAVSELLAQSHMAQSCLAYLLHVETLPFAECQAKPLQLSAYAAKYWINHMIQAQETQDGTHAWTLMKQLFALKKGSSANWVKLAGFSTALEAAAFHGYQPIVQHLLEMGEDVNDAGEHGGTALEAAASRGHEGVVRLLLEKGANVDAVGGNYGGALYAASLEGYEDVVRLLLEKGVDANLKGRLLGSALHAARSRRYDMIVKLLLEKGAVMEDDDAMII